MRLSSQTAFRITLSLKTHPRGLISNTGDYILKVNTLMTAINFESLVDRFSGPTDIPMTIV